MPTHRLDLSASTLVLRTRAAGLLARLAHDLEIAAPELTAEATVDAAGAWSAEIVVPVAALRVAGTLHGDRLDRAGLSASDRAEVERKIREEVLAGTREVRVRASGASRDQAEARVALAQGAATVKARLSATDQPGGAVRVTGSSALSMRALGLREVKGPLGSFKLRDEIEVLFELTLRPEG